MQNTTPPPDCQTDTPLLRQCGLQPTGVDDSKWRRLILWSDDCQKSTALPVASTHRVKLLQAGGVRVFHAFQNGMTAAAVRREMREARRQIICDPPAAEARARGVAI